MKKHIRRLKAWWRQRIEGPKLPFALGIAMVLTIVMTFTSVGIYYVAGFYKFDLSRPGYEKERTQVTNSANDIHGNYDSTTPVTAAATDTFLRDFDAGTQKASLAGDFRDQSLSDQELGL